ncbi:hypothetical protein AO067_23170 [Pseudomonas viridiflava ICMP 13104]|uniref:Uncharacterized protein n=1 Tax=Pseudomonas viridiflava ICMP 13104 TaxID=1198305 RepID=A0A0W0HEK7_PSEVI|nr:hypothetical protein AO067_23170 [Pseudomonas viridiflava ICMP 13104]
MHLDYFDDFEWSSRGIRFHFFGEGRPPGKALACCDPEQIYPRPGVEWAIFLKGVDRGGCYDRCCSGRTIWSRLR